MAMGSFRPNPLLLRFAIFVAVPLLAGVLWLAQQARSSLPDDRIRLPANPSAGLTAPADIVRDGRGVPVITAQTAADAAFAIGYAQAQDRLWQLELQRRTTAGRLAEILGEAALDSDIWYRTMDLRGAAAEALTRLSPAARQSLTAYANGVNARLRNGQPLPLEFALLDVVPEPWTPLDSLAWMKAFALDLGGNMDRELDFVVAVQWLGKARAESLFPGYAFPAADGTAGALAGDAAAFERLGRFRARLAASSRKALPGSGSNAWALSGQWTGTGRAILANDPHLGLAIPSVWYAQTVRSPEWSAAGAAIVGLPLVIFGRNDAIAWGGTNLMADSQDLYFELLSNDARSYRTTEGWAPIRFRTETIKVRAARPESLHAPLKPLVLNVRATQRGPLVSDVIPGFDRPLSLRWTGHDADDTTYEAFFQINRAANWTDFRRSLDLLVAPALNLLFADRNGRIGYQAAGRIPRRLAGAGNLPAAGWDRTWAWDGEIPRDRLPAEWNPAAGVLVSANDAPKGQYGYHISADWASPARAERIASMIAQLKQSGRAATPDAMAAIQRDMLDLDAARLMGLLRPWFVDAAVDPRLAAVMQTWHGSMRGDSAGAAIFRLWLHHIREGLVAAQASRPLPGSEIDRRFVRIIHSASVRALGPILSGNGDWCAPAGQSSCKLLAQRALLSAQAELIKLTGHADPEQWRLDDIQQIDYAHPPFASWKPFDQLLGRRIGHGGSENTVNAVAGAYREAEGFNLDFGSGFRQVITLRGTATGHWLTLSTGQSGNPASRHYDDMLPTFYRPSQPRPSSQMPAAVKGSR